VRLLGSDSLLLGAFAVLAIGSVGLKAAVGVPLDGLADARPGQLEDQLADQLRSQGFSTFVHPYMMRSPAVFAERGDCRLSVRDARGGAEYVAVFASDARAIGPVRYFYGGRSYREPPALAFRVGRLETELQTRFGFRTMAHVPVAVATSAGCAGNDFGLSDARLSL